MEIIKILLIAVSFLMSLCGAIFWANDDKDPDAGWAFAVAFLCVAIYQRLSLE